MEVYHFETEADVRRHFGVSRAPRRSHYDRAWTLLEKADHRWTKADAIEGYDAARAEPGFYKEAGRIKAQLYAAMWPRDRIGRWTLADNLARLAALAAVEDCRDVAQCRQLVEQAPDTRSYAKAVAARIEMEAAVWAVAYAHAMRKEFKG